MSDKSEKLYSCRVCNEGFAQKWEHHEHIHSYSHMKKLDSCRKGETIHTCSCCEVTMNRMQEFANHINTDKHKQLLQKKIQGMKDYDERMAARKKRNEQRQSFSQRHPFNNPRHSNYTASRNQGNRFGNRFPSQNSQFRLDRRSPRNNDEYIHLNSDGGFRGNPQGWNRPFGYQYPYNQPPPYGDNYRPHYTQHPVPPEGHLPDTQFPPPLMDIPVQNSSLDSSNRNDRPSSVAGDSLSSHTSTDNMSTSSNSTRKNLRTSSPHSDAAPQSSTRDRSNSKSEKSESKMSPKGTPAQALASSVVSSSSKGGTGDLSSSANNSSTASPKPVVEKSSSTSKRRKSTEAVASETQQEEKVPLIPPAKMKQEPVSDIFDSKKPETVAKAKAKKKITATAVKRGSLQGLLQGRAASRHLQYELDKAVKERRTGQGRRYNIENDGALLTLPESCELKNATEIDVAEVRALLADAQQDPPTSTFEPQPSTSGLAAEPVSSNVTDEPPATAAPKKKLLRSQKKTKCVKPSPPKSTVKGKKRKGSTVSKKVPAKKNKVVTSKKGKPTKAERIEKKKEKAKAKINKSRVGSSADNPSTSSSDQGEESPTTSLKAEVEENKTVISQLLSMSMREEKIREELPTLETELMEMTEKRDELVKKTEELNEKIAATSTKIHTLTDEESTLRKSRLEILTKAKESKAAESSTVIQQADTTSSMADLVSNAQYLGGFFTADADEEQQVFNNLQQRVRHLSQSSETESKHSSCSNKGLSKIEQRMQEIVQSQKRKSGQGDKEVIFEGHVRAVQHLVVKGDYLYSGGGDHTLRRFAVKTGACINTYNGHEALVKCFVVLSKHESKTIIYSVDLDGTLLLFDADLATILKRHTLQQNATCLIEAWGSIYIGLQNGDIISYHVKEANVAEKYPTGSSGIMSMCTAQEGARRLLICGSYDCLIAVRDVKSGLLLRMMPDAKHLPRCMTADDMRPYLYVTSNDCLKIYNYQKGNVIKEIRTGSSDIRSISTSKTENCTFLFTASQNGAVCQFNISALQLTNVYQHTNPLLVITSDKKGRIYVGDKNGEIRSFEIVSDSITCKIGTCELPLAGEEHLVNHIFTNHVTEVVAQQTCPWRGCASSIHHKSAAELRNHLLAVHVSK